MYAIVSIAGQQFKVEKNKKVFVHRLEGDEGSTMEFDRVMLIDDEGKVKLGTPFIKNARVTAKIVSHLKGDKVLIFKKKRRKSYQKMNGHRQYLTEILIDEILENVVAKKTSAVPKKEKKEEAVKSEPVVETAAVAEEIVVKEKPQKAKKPAAKKAESDKPKAKTTAKKTTKASPKAKTDTKKTTKAEPKTKSDKKQSGNKK
jgi:large subunit ribosomal protein L21